MQTDPGRTQLAEQLRRERLLDIEARLRPYRRRAFAVLGVALLSAGAWLGWWWMAALVGAAAGFLVSDRVMARSARPERWAGIGWGFAGVMIALSVALTGGAESPAVPWFALPAVTLGARFERRGVIVGLAYLVLLLLASTIPLDPGIVTDKPYVVVFPAALTIAVTMLSGAVIQSEREHRRGAIIDPLTGLLNRNALAQRFAELEQQARLQRAAMEQIGFLVGDLDHFKRVNDEHGHAAGDAVLRRAAYAMRNGLRAFDLVYRIGGEEFVVVLPGAGTGKSVEIAERLRAAVAESGPPGIPVTISFGVASGRGDGLSFSALYERADRALYEAKAAGRNRVVVAASVGEPARDEGSAAHAAA
jgi:diguanylate cyclase (GGDEF)-like protein